MGYIRSEHTAALACIPARTLEHPPPSFGQPDSPGTPPPDEQSEREHHLKRLCATSPRHFANAHSSVTNHRPSTTLPLHYPPITTLSRPRNTGTKQDDRGKDLNRCAVWCPSDQTMRFYVHKRNFGGKDGPQRMPDLACPALLSVFPSAQSIQSHRGIYRNVPRCVPTLASSVPCKLCRAKQKLCRAKQETPRYIQLNNNNNNAQKHETNSNAHLKPRSRPTSTSTAPKTPSSPLPPPPPRGGAAARPSPPAQAAAAASAGTTYGPHQDRLSARSPSPRRPS